MKLNRTYGPSPWYVAGLKIRASAREFRWVYAGPDEPFAGVVVLKTAGRRVVIALAMYSYVHLLPDGRLLVWHPEPTPAGQRAEHVLFTAVELGAVKPVADLAKAGQRLSRGMSALETEPAPSATFRLTLDRPRGPQPVEVPDWLRLDHELLLLVNGTDPPVRTIWRLAPKGRELDVLPQEWFKSGDFDLGYQWITRIGRDRRGRLVGDGIRIAPFRLDETGCRVDAWLEKSPLDEA